VARIFPIPQTTSFDWLYLYRSGGRDTLNEGHRCGRARTVSADDMKWTYQAVTFGNLQQFQLDSFCNN